MAPTITDRQFCAYEPEVEFGELISSVMVLSVGAAVPGIWLVVSLEESVEVMAGAVVLVPVDADIEDARDVVDVEVG